MIYGTIAFAIFFFFLGVMAGDLWRLCRRKRYHDLTGERAGSLFQIMSKGDGIRVRE